MSARGRIAALAALGAGAWLAASVLQAPLPLPPPAPAAPAPAPAAAPALPALPDAAALAAALARPPFAPDRRPPSAAALPAAAPVPLPAALAVAIGAGRRVALLRLQEGGPVLRVAEGGQAGPWRVLQVQPGHVILQGGDGTAHALRLPGARRAEPGAPTLTPSPAQEPIRVARP